jgi:hypothetical protein
LDSLVGARFVDHQTGSCEDSILVGANDRFVDGFRASKIIGVNNQSALWGAIAHAGGETVGSSPSAVKLQLGFEHCRQSANLTAKGHIMSLRDAYQQKLEARFQEQKAQLDLLRARAKRAAAHSKILAYEELANADTHLTEAKAKLKILADAGGSAMSELKSGVSRAFADLKTASQRAADHLRANISAPPPSKPGTGKTVKDRPAARPRRAAPAPSAARTKGH